MSQTPVITPNNLPSERTDRNTQEHHSRLLLNPLRSVNARSNASDLTNRERSIENILLSLEVRKKQVNRRFPYKVTMGERTIKLPAIVRNIPLETRYNLTEELDKFEDRLSRRNIKPFSQLSREESMLLQDCQGYRRLKQLRSDPRYPQNLSESHCS